MKEGLKKTKLKEAFKWHECYEGYAQRTNNSGPTLNMVGSLVYVVARARFVWRPVGNEIQVLTASRVRVKSSTLTVITASLFLGSSLGDMMGCCVVQLQRCGSGRRRHAEEARSR